MSHRIHRLSLACLGAVMCWLAFSPRSSLAQFLFLDTNGDARSSPGDVLNPVGEPTTVNVYLDTSRNPDSSVAYCSTGSEPLSIVSYEFILHAVGGTVTFGNYTNAHSTMGVSFGTGSNSIDFYRGFGGSTILPPGLYQLGTLTVTVQTGSPTLNPASATSLSPHYGTSFGTQCLGSDGDNTYKLGLNWFGIAGCGPPAGANAAPAVAVPGTVSAFAGEPTLIVGEFYDADASDSLAISVAGLSPGLTAVDAPQEGGRKQIRLYGAPDPGIQPGTSFDVEWLVTDGSISQTLHSDLVIGLGPSSNPQFEDSVRGFFVGDYSHGLPRVAGRAFGKRALPILAQMLRASSNKQYWHQIALGIGCIGDTSYFDTLKAFIWTRFHGPIDWATYKAMMQAQASLGLMATQSARVRAYLESTISAQTWHGVPWTRPAPDTPEYVGELMGAMTLASISYTDSQWAGSTLSSLSSMKPRIEMAITDGLRVNRTVRRNGLVKVWEEQDQVRP